MVIFDIYCIVTIDIRLNRSKTTKMAGIEVVHDGLDYEALFTGYEQAVDKYNSLTESGPIAIGSGHDEPVREGDVQTTTQLVEGRSVKDLDVFVPNVLYLTEDTDLIKSTKTWSSVMEFGGFDYDQDATNMAVATVVARAMWHALNTDRARSILPDRTVALFEVNTNRGFPVGRENRDHAYGFRRNWLGHVTADMDFKGQDFCMSTDGNSGRNEYVDFLYEVKPGTSPSLSYGILRNAARIRIRPAHPITSYWAANPYLHDNTPQQEHAARLALAHGEELPEGVAGPRFDNHHIIRSEYNISRALVILDDPRHWSNDEFANRRDLVISQERL